MFKTTRLLHQDKKSNGTNFFPKESIIPASTFLLFPPSRGYFNGKRVLLLRLDLFVIYLHQSKSSRETRKLHFCRPFLTNDQYNAMTLFWLPCEFNFSSGIRLEFIKPIKDVTVKERETAEFSVELSHENIPVVWYKNDVRLHPSKVVHMSQERRVHTLSIKEVALDDTSTIKVEALGKTSEAMLTVLG